MKIFLRKVNKLNRGYTIIETMIAVSLFLVVVMAGMGALLNANLIHEKSKNMRSIMDNLSFIMDDISKNLRTGYNYHCFPSGLVAPSTTYSYSIIPSFASTPQSCDFGFGIAFEAANGDSNNYIDQWFYYIDNGKIFKSTQGPYYSYNFVQLTPDEVVIDPISGFSVLGAEPSSAGNFQQPLVNIRLIGTITLKGTTTPFSLQTSVSQRLLDI